MNSEEQAARDARLATAHAENAELLALLADDASTFPDGHPCRDCDRLYDEHLSGDQECEGWR